jgi:hypothetical protein
MNTQTTTLSKEPTTEEIEKAWKKYNDELDRAYNKWKDQSLLEGVPEKNVKQVALILENQYLFLQGSDCSYKQSFRDLAMEVTAKVFRNFLGFDMVSIQTYLGPTSKMFYLKYIFKSLDPQGDSDPNTLYMMDPEASTNGTEISLGLTYKESSAKTKKMKTWRSHEEYEAEGAADTLADEIRDQITREIMTDLRNNAGTVATMAMSEDEFDYERIYIKTVELSSVIHRKTLRGGGNWLVTGREIGKVLAKGAHIDLDEDTIDIKKIGVLNNRWSLIVDPLFPKNEILYGYYEPFVEGYIYSPYIFLSATPVVLDPESFSPRQGLLTRYDKKLISPKPYARLKFTPAT